MKNVKFSSILDIALKVISIICLGMFCSQLMTLFGCDFKQLLPDSEYLFIIVLRWLTFSAVGMAVITPWFGTKHVKLILPIFALVIGVLNLAMLDKNMIMWGMGRAEYSVEAGFAYNDARKICFIIEQICLILIGGAYTFLDIKNKEWKGAKPLWIILVLAGFLLTFDYPYLIQDLNRVLGFTTNKTCAIDFSAPHILLLSLNFILLIGLTLLLRNAPMESKRLALVAMSLSACFNFFYVVLYGKGWFAFDSIPIHLCNLAVILLLFAFAFHLEGVFYFTLFVNVLGTIFAMLMPNYEKTTIWYNYETLRFWYNHLYAFILPILGITLKVFERPKMKSMFKAIGIFTLYFIFAAIMNAWFSNYGKVSYFFINDNFFFEKLNIASGLKDNYVWEFTVGTLTFKFFPLFYLVVYGVFVALMFVVWYVYDFFFNVSDSHVKIHYKKKLLKEFLNLLLFHLIKHMKELKKIFQISQKKNYKIIWMKED